MCARTAAAKAALYQEGRGENHGYQPRRVLLMLQQYLLVCLTLSSRHFFAAAGKETEQGQDAAGEAEPMDGRRRKPHPLKGRKRPPGASIHYQCVHSALPCSLPMKSF